MPKVANKALPVIVKHPDFDKWRRKHNPPTTFSAAWTKKALEDLGIPWEGGVFINIPDDDPGSIQLLANIQMHAPEKLTEEDKKKVALYTPKPKPTVKAPTKEAYVPPPAEAIPKLEQPEPIVTMANEDYQAMVQGPPSLPIAKTLQIYEELKMSLIELGSNFVLYREGLSDEEVGKRCYATAGEVAMVREEAFGVLATAQDPQLHFMMRRMSDLDTRLGRLEELIAKAASKRA